jgi:hypothetical protein
MTKFVILCKIYIWLHDCIIEYDTSNRILSYVVTYLYTYDFYNYNRDYMNIKQFQPLDHMGYTWNKIYFWPMLCQHMAITNLCS